jgi:hypothetical protein
MEEVPRRAGKLANGERVLQALVMLHPHSFPLYSLIYILMFPFSLSFKITTRYTKPIGNLFVIAEAMVGPAYIILA